MSFLKYVGNFLNKIVNVKNQENQKTVVASVASPL